MKIRDLILAVLIAGMIISTGTLVAFATTGIGDIKNTTSEASSGELMDIATDGLRNSAFSIRNSLDNQMRAQHSMVKTWALEPAVLTLAQTAAELPRETLFDYWSNPETRQYADNIAVADGDISNDLDPSVSQYLMDLVDGSHFTEIFVTDNRGYTIASSGPTSDFDQGPEDWNLVLENGEPVFKQIAPTNWGEDWYQEAKSYYTGFIATLVTWDDESDTWSTSFVSQLRNPENDEYLGMLKATFDYTAFVEQFIYSEAVDFYEVKIVDQEGIVVATSLNDRSKVNNPAYNIKGFEYYKNAVNVALGKAKPASGLDENGEMVYAGTAVSRDANGHIVVVSIEDERVENPINSFVGNLQSNISDRGSSLSTTMVIIGIAVALAIIVAATLIMRAKVAIPLKKLTAVSDSLSRGEIDGLTIDIEGKDEISSFGESFKGVLAAFNFLKDEVEKKQ